MPSWPWKKKSLPTGVRIYDGTEMESYLKKHPTVLYQYQANTYGLIVLMVMALVALGLATYIWISTGWASISHGLALGLLLLTALGSISLVAYWFYLTKIHYLAASDSDLIIGKGKRVVAIHWSVLDAETLGFGGLDSSSSNTAVMSVRLKGVRYRLRLFTRYACLKNLQGFMSTLLEHIRPESEEAH